MTQEAAEAKAREMYPHVPQHAATLVRSTIEISSELAMNSKSNPEVFAIALANKHGAFPWQGPYGNGLSKSWYQGEFREMAAEHIALLTEYEKD